MSPAEFGQVRRIRLLSRTDLPVVAVLVVWGSNLRRLPDGWTRRNGVMVVAGPQMRQWRKRGTVAKVHPDTAVVDAARTYTDRFDKASA
jgi:hypothetical protein